ncbi:MAG: 2-hydroxyglutaryl-CoA dehydratase [Dehalococcoidales bacterium]|nr:2-hydroxyglutaryl-CoA dehydratase [Dehalococcoidales bacterium]
MYAGIDLGSVTTKIVLLDEQGEVAFFSKVRTGFDRNGSGVEVLQQALHETGKTEDDINYTVTTGYGRRSYEHSDKALPEIICHAKGTKRLFPEVKTIIDIGGQDSKVIQVDDKGNVTRFEMNDKCAAGTGRFLEVLTERILNLDIEELGPLSLKSDDPCSLSSICTVFAESEILSLISENRSKEDIACGMSKAIAKRVISMGNTGQIRYEDQIIFSGGVAMNQGVVKAIEEELGRSVTTPDEPQVTAALGAAVFAMEAAG